jgi:hypothetical protein
MATTCSNSCPAGVVSVGCDDAVGERAEDQPEQGREQRGKGLAERFLPAAGRRDLAEEVGDDDEHGRERESGRHSGELRGELGDRPHIEGRGPARHRRLR